MPAYIRGAKRDQLRFVLLNTIFAYGWKTVDLAARTGISAADLSTQLGHMTAAEADAVPNRIMVTGANSPKPARVVMRDLTAPVGAPGSTSTYLAYDKLAAATTAGWSLAKQSRGVGLTANIDGKRSVTAIAELSNGLLYAFPLNKADFDRVSAALGLVDAASITTAAENNSLATGSRTKPGKCATDDSEGTFSTFYATAAKEAVLAAGYSVKSTEFIEYSAAAAPPP